MRTGRRCSDAWRRWLVALIERNALTPGRERAEGGNVLAQLGDPRPGILLLSRPQGFPDLLWCEIPAGPFTMGSRKKSIRRHTKTNFPQFIYPIRHRISSRAIR